ncbi:MAG: Uncharacterized protein Greene041679_30, partial [Parcubacteria group bacterium Greene0416_79]
SGSRPRRLVWSSRRGLRLHPLLILLSVLGGLAFFGPVGFLAGPVTLALLFALLVAFIALAGWGINGCHNEMNARGVTRGGAVILSEIAAARSELARAQQTAAPRPQTWHGLTGGFETNLTIRGEWSDKIFVFPTHRIKWDDSPRNVLLRINGTNIVHIWGGRQTNRIEFLELKTEDGTLANLQIATGLPLP